MLFGIIISSLAIYYLSEFRFQTKTSKVVKKRNTLETEVEKK
jgi:uncharacterized membrane protein YdjX (TVP38/TMEM64 family)